MDRVNDLQPWSGIYELEAVIWHQDAVVASFRHIETTEDVLGIYKVYVESFLTIVKPILEHAGQLVGFVQEVCPGELDDHLRHRLDEHFLSEIWELDRRVVRDVEETKVFLEVVTDSQLHICVCTDNLIESWSQTFEMSVWYYFSFYVYLYHLLFLDYEDTIEGDVSREIVPIDSQSDLWRPNLYLLRAQFLDSRVSMIIKH